MGRTATKATNWNDHFLFYASYFFVDSFSAKKIRMANDSVYALALLGIFGIVILRGRFTAVTLEVLISLTRPGATVLLLGITLYLYTIGMTYTALVFALLSVYLLQDVWKTWINSDARRLYLDIGRDQARFNSSTSVDLQWANRAIIHDSPNMLHKDADATPLLLYPPSQATLESMSG